MNFHFCSLLHFICLSNIVACHLRIFNASVYRAIIFIAYLQHLSLLFTICYCSFKVRNACISEQINRLVGAINTVTFTPFVAAPSSAIIHSVTIFIGEGKNKTNVCTSFIDSILLVRIHESGKHAE